MAELYQKGLLSEDDLSFLPQYMMGYMYRHWLDFLVNVQYTKSDDVHARTFEILRRYSQTKSGKERQTKPTGETVHYFHLHGWTNCIICNFVGTAI